MTNNRDTTCILAGDIGGTKTNLGLFREVKERPELKVIETFASQEAPDLEYYIRKFLQGHKVSVCKACFGVAGPVVNEKSKITTTIIITATIVNINVNPLLFITFFECWCTRVLLIFKHKKPLNL